MKIFNEKTARTKGMEKPSQKIGESIQKCNDNINVIFCIGRLNLTKYYINERIR